MRIDHRKIFSLICILFFWPIIALSQQKNTFTMALTGDAIITRKLSVYQEPEFLKMTGLLRSADVAFTNLEILRNFGVQPQEKIIVLVK